MRAVPHYAACQFFELPRDKGSKTSYMQAGIAARGHQPSKYVMQYTHKHCII